jgi:hypothetical protein
MFGLMIMLMSLSADFVEIGTYGFGFGTVQSALVLVGLNMFLWGCLFSLNSQRKICVYGVSLAIAFFLVWLFELYPLTRLFLPHISQLPFSFTVLLFSHAFILVSSLIFFGVAARTTWSINCFPLKRSILYIANIRKKMMFGAGMITLIVIFGAFFLEMGSLLLVPSWPLRELRPIALNDTLAKYVDIKLNSWGLRDQERTLSKPLGVTRILFLGDSFLEGAFCQDTLSGYVHKELQHNGVSNIECVNLGVSATGLQHYLYRLRNVGMKLSPDKVFLFVYMGNDLAHVSLEDQPLRVINERPLPSIVGTLMPRFTWFIVNRFNLSEVVQSTKYIPNEFDSLYNMSQMPYELGVQKLAHHMHKFYFPNISQGSIKEILSQKGPTFWRPLQSQKMDREYLMGWRIKILIETELNMPARHLAYSEIQPNHHILHATLSYIEQIAKELQKKAISLVVFLIPFDENVDSEYREFWSPWHDGDKYAPWLKAQRKALFSMLQEQRISVVDLAENLDGVPGAYRKFDGHWTEKGHEIVAGKVVQIIDTR